MYFRFVLSYRVVEEMIASCGVVEIKGRLGLNSVEIAE